MKAFFTENKADIAIIPLAAVAVSVMVMAPVLVGQMIHEYGFTASEAGYVISAELGGMGLASLPAFWWIKKFNWRTVARLSILFLALGNVVSAFLTDYTALFAARLVFALGAGNLMVICMASSGKMKNKDRSYGLWISGQLLLGMIGLMILPRVFEISGLWVFYAAFAIAILTVYPLTRFMPTGQEESHDQQVAKAAGLSPADMSAASVPIIAKVICIIGFFFFYVSINGLWTYYERIGNEAGYDAKSVGDILAISSIFGVLGALTGVFIAGRIKRSYIVALSYLLVFTSVVTLLQWQDIIGYTTSVVVFKYAGGFAFPFLMGTIATLDRGGTMIVFANIMTGGGLAIGPAVAAAILDRGGSYQLIIYTMLCLSIFSGSVMWFMARLGERFEHKRGVAQGTVG